jgi:hypothetical protein
MKVFSLLVMMILFHLMAFAMPWSKGTVTKPAWYDTGGYQVEIDHIRYVFIKTARIKYDDRWYDVPDRAHLLTPKTRVRIQKEGFRIYALEIEGR